MKIRTYSELITIQTFEERYEYLRLYGQVGKDTFGFDRYLNQMLYMSREWKQARSKVIARDNGWDLGIEGFEIYDSIAVHHMNPITPDDIKSFNPDIFNPEYLITTAAQTTHKAIHYSDINLLPREPITRRPNDTIPWRT